MKKTKFLFALLVAVATMAFSPTKVWADNTVTVKTSSGTQQYASLQDALEALNDNWSKTVYEIVLEKDQTLPDGASIENYHDVILNLNGHTIDGSYEAYEEEWSDEANDWVKIPESDYIDYKSFIFSGDLTIKNGVLKASISGTGDSNKLTIDGATVIGSGISWQAEAGIDIVNGSTLNLDAGYGAGQFTFEACTLDATSQILLTGINSIGMYGKLAGGYRHILHRLQLPEGYVLKQPFSDFNYAIYTTDDLEKKANMKGITLTIKGSDPIAECTEIEYMDVYKHNDDWTSYWTDYCRVCTLCHDVKEEGSVLSEDGIIYTYNYGGEEPAKLTIGDGGFTTTDPIVISDSKPFYAPVDIAASSVTYTRSIAKDDGKYSFIVPFDIPAAQAAELGTFYQYARHEEGKVYFDDITKADGDGAVKANTAYFFDPAASISSITVENTTIKANKDVDATAPSEVGLYGTFSQVAIPVGAYGYGHEGTFVKAGEGNTLHQFRAYLWLGDEDSAASVRAVFGLDDADAVARVETTASDAAIYNLAGVRLNKLQKGINIVGDKKIVVK